MINTSTHHYFYMGPFSNFYYARFRDPLLNLHFDNTEQAFMFQKAMFFKDEGSADEIMLAESPHQAKELGRKVRFFDAKLWDCVKFGLMVYVNYLKFSQDEGLRKRLEETGDRVLVEVSPSDCIWGIGLQIHDEKIFDEKNWRGQNLLGKALMEVRRIL